MASSPWPYASVVDPSWMASTDDPLLVAARDAVRSRLPRAARPVSAEHLVDAISTAQQLRDRMDWILLALVGEGRAEGLSWAQLGAALGVRKQAAHQRFGPYVDAALAQARAGEE